MHQSSLKKMWDFRNKYLEGKTNCSLLILDLGSMDVNGSYRECFNSPQWTYIGLDLAPGKNVDIVLKNPYDWSEVKGNSVDVIISGQAFEHIEYFWLTALEIGRVLKSGGLCCIIAPSAGPEHRYPVDCWRFYPDGFAAIARFAKLDILELYTDWEKDVSYTDCSNNWHDTMMIAKSHHDSGVGGWLSKIRRSIIQKLMISECSTLLNKA